jgi:hypothetical protein
LKSLNLKNWYVKLLESILKTNNHPRPLLENKEGS